MLRPSQNVKNFDADKGHYLSKGYLEAQARVDFITPFFEALGWDVRNQAGLTFQDREVLVEKGESDMTGRPDYSFRVAGQTKFFVEAKAPSEGLDHPKHIVQAKQYAWNTRQVFFVVLTDFAEFRFYDASIRPDERKPEEGLLLKIAYPDYSKNAEKLWEFSKERVNAGSLDAMLPRDLRTQRLRIPVDQVFLDEMTGWRGDLARDIYKNNPRLNGRQLNELVQRLLDRIVFIRIAEDRRIIEKRQLADVVDEWKARGGKYDISEWLRPLFEKINDDFNGEIFKPNELLEEAKVSSEVLARIIERLYPPKSPYRFDVIGVELLGSIYERYLGNTIRTTAHQVRVEEKPEVRKAGGVYYTPQYVVDYIVKNTVGNLIAGKTPKQIEKIRILDPSCGSGSFLIGAFQYLIDYHVRYLAANPKEAEVHPLYPDLIRDENGEQRLSVVRKARILRNNLYGVDIDPQAVEITMMSLYLKALEGERSLLPPKQHLLPELKYNIICGNSIISTDISEQRSMYGEEKDRINPLDWECAFPAIMKAGRFDAVIGNPPWVFTREGDFADAMKKYIDYTYLRNLVGSQQGRAKQSGKINLFAIFILRSIELLKERGQFGYIVPNTLLRATVYDVIRKYLLDSTKIRVVADLGSGVFEHVTASTVILILEKAKADSKHFVRVANGFEAASSGHTTRVPQRGFLDNTSFAFDLYSNASSAKIIARMTSGSAGLGEVCTIHAGGIATGPGKNSYISSRKLSAIYKPLIEGKDIGRYSITFRDRFILYDRKKLYRAREESIFLAEEKLVTQRIAGGDHALSVGYDDQQLYTFNSTNLILKKSESLYSLKYVLGLLNSRLLNWYYIVRFTNRSALTVNVSKTYLEKLPIHCIDFSAPAEKRQHDNMLKLVDLMLELNKKMCSGRLAPSELDRVERDIVSTDAKIDDLVFELYDITDKERRFLEEETGGRPSDSARLAATV